MKTEDTFHVTLTELQRFPPILQYTVNGKNKPTLTLKKGKKYRFVVDAPGHPLYLTTSPLGGKNVPGSISDKVDEKGMVSDKGDLFVVLEREIQPGTLYYQSTTAENVGGKILVV